MLNHRLILLALMLTACAGPDVNGYQPTLAKKPAEKVIYDKDLDACKYAVLHPPGSILGGFGLLGGVATQLTNQQKMYNDWLPFGERVDACMTEKGYKIASK